MIGAMRWFLLLAVAGCTSSTSVSDMGAGADFAGADFAGADLAGADFAGVDFAQPDLAGADFAGVDFAAVDFAHSTDLAGADLAGTQLLTVTRLGVQASGGIVTSGGGEIDCGGSCTAAIAGGSMVTLTASVTPRSGTLFQAWGGDCAANNLPTCTVTMNAARNVSATFIHVNYAFVTSAVTGMPLGANGAASLAKADMVCNQLAAGKLPGQFVAWLSVAGDGSGANPHVDAKDRLGSARGWVLADDTPFADSAATLLAGKIFRPPRVKEDGSFVGPDSQIATGTLSDGTLDAGHNCTDWSSTGTPAGWSFGFAGASSAQWTNLGPAGVAACIRGVELYCFGTDFTTTLAPPRASGRTAFLSHTTLDTSVGMTGLDGLCRTEAMAAGLPNAANVDSYHAFLSGVSPATSAKSRFDVTGAPWVRTDGIALVQNAADLFDPAKPLLSTLNVEADGVTYVGSSTTATLVVTGTLDPSKAATSLMDTCNDYSGSPAAALGEAGAPYTVGNRWFKALPQSPCNMMQRVYCLEK
jgi:hypothetical protein